MVSRVAEIGDGSRIPPEIKRPPLHVQAKNDSDVPAIIPADFPSHKFLRLDRTRAGLLPAQQPLRRWMRGRPEDHLS